MSEPARSRPAIGFALGSGSAGRDGLVNPVPVAVWRAMGGGVIAVDRNRDRMGPAFRSPAEDIAAVDATAPACIAAPSRCCRIWPI